MENTNCQNKKGIGSMDKCTLEHPTVRFLNDADCQKECSTTKTLGIYIIMIVFAAFGDLIYHTITSNDGYINTINHLSYLLPEQSTICKQNKVLCSIDLKYIHYKR